MSTSLRKARKVAFACVRVDNISKDDKSEVSDTKLIQEESAKKNEEKQKEEVKSEESEEESEESVPEKKEEPKTVTMRDMYNSKGLRFW